MVLLTWCAVHVAQFLSTTAIAAVKGSDASGVHDEEPPVEVISRIFLIDTPAHNYGRCCIVIDALIYTTRTMFL